LFVVSGALDNAELLVEEELLVDVVLLLGVVLGIAESEFAVGEGFANFADENLVLLGLGDVRRFVWILRRTRTHFVASLFTLLILLAHIVDRLVNFFFLKNMFHCKAY